MPDRPEENPLFLSDNTLGEEIRRGRETFHLGGAGGMGFGAGAGIGDGGSGLGEGPGMGAGGIGYGFWNGSANTLKVIITAHIIDKPPGIQ